MFTIYTKSMSDDEIKALYDIWDAMGSSLCEMYSQEAACDECKYKRLCQAIDLAQNHLDKTLTKRAEQKQ